MTGLRRDSIGQPPKALAQHPGRQLRASRKGDQRQRQSIDRLQFANGLLGNQIEDERACEDTGGQVAGEVGQADRLQQAAQRGRQPRSRKKPSAARRQRSRGFPTGRCSTSRRRRGRAPPSAWARTRGSCGPRLRRTRSSLDGPSASLDFRQVNDDLTALAATPAVSPGVRANPQRRLLPPLPSTPTSRPSRRRAGRLEQRLRAPGHHSQEARDRRRSPQHQECPSSGPLAILAGRRSATAQDSATEMPALLGANLAPISTSSNKSVIGRLVVVTTPLQPTRASLRCGRPRSRPTGRRPAPADPIARRLPPRERACPAAPPRLGSRLDPWPAARGKNRLPTANPKAKGGGQNHELRPAVQRRRRRRGSATRPRAASKGRKRGTRSSTAVTRIEKSRSARPEAAGGVNAGENGSRFDPRCA